MLISMGVTDLSTPFLLIHVVNNKQVMGKGVAKAISDKWPQVKTDYLEFFKQLHADTILGSIVLTQVADTGYVASMICQDGYGNDGKRYLDYQALHACMEQVARIATNLNVPVYAPFNIGCGLAGGNWELTQKIIESHHSVTFCKP